MNQKRTSTVSFISIVYSYIIKSICFIVQLLKKTIQIHPSCFPNMLAVLLPRGPHGQIASRGPAQVDAPAVRQGHGAQGGEDHVVP